MAFLHHQWIQDAATDIQRDYDRLYAQATERGRAQEVGHGNETIWQNFLTNWLPPQYEVATRKYIVGTKDTDENPFETDLVVFHPGYPRRLRTESHVMAAGVAAAFSTKLTLRRAGLAEAAESSHKLQQMLVTEEGSARTELWKPYVYGILSASHTWKAENSRPVDNIENALFDDVTKYAMHPSAMLDLICVADLALWSKTADFWVHFEDDEDPATFIAAKIQTTHYRPNSVEANPLTLLLSALYEFLSWRNEDMKPIARDFKMTNPQPGGAGWQHSWPVGAVLSVEAIKGLQQADPTKTQGKDSWHQMAIL